MSVISRFADRAPGCPGLGSRRLWNLWDMLRFNAKPFYDVVTALDSLRTQIASLEAEGPKAINDPVVLGYLRGWIEELRAALRTLGAQLTLISANRFLALVNNPGELTWRSVGGAWEEVHSRLSDELGLAQMFVLGSREADYYEPKASHFGPDVGAKFPTAIFDIDEAAKCIALGRPTASVFHSMRVVEIGANALSACLGIPASTRGGDRNWGAILRKFKEAIADKGSGKTPPFANLTDKVFFDDAYASLDAVKNAWRNPTMHVDTKHTDDEAEAIFLAIRGFMKKLASRLDENGQPLA